MYLYIIKIVWDSDVLCTIVLITVDIHIVYSCRGLGTMHSLNYVGKYKIPQGPMSVPNMYSLYACGFFSVSRFIQL